MSASMTICWSDMSFLALECKNQTLMPYHNMSRISNYEKVYDHVLWFARNHRKKQCPHVCIYHDPLRTQHALLFNCLNILYEYIIMEPLLYALLE